MGQVHCFTSASFSYLDRVRVLGETLRRFQPNWTFWLCLSDREPEGFAFDPENEPIDRVVRLEELAIPDLERWTFAHDVVELCTAVKGPFLRQLLEAGAQKVVYLDPDIALFGDLTAVEELLERHSVILTPHLLEPEVDQQDIVVNEVSALKHGIYNLGFAAVANCEEGRKFADWWSRRLLDHCFDDVPNGLFTDQKWCDHVPVFFPHAHILRDPGYNSASWNQGQRPIAFESDGSITAGGSQLKFYHFTKITKSGQRMLERYGCRSLPVFELVKWYRTQLAVHSAAGLPSRWWAYNFYDDGSVIPRAHRVAFRQRRSLWERYPHPFAAGSGSLKEHLLDEAA